jgi:hypothetical protein
MRYVRASGSDSESVAVLEIQTILYVSQSGQDAKSRRSPRRLKLVEQGGQSVGGDVLSRLSRGLAALGKPPIPSFERVFPDSVMHAGRFFGREVLDASSNGPMGMGDLATQQLCMRCLSS